MGAEGTVSDPNSLDLLRAVLDPVRLAVLGAAASRAVDISELSELLGRSRGDIARAVGDLRSAGLLRPDGTLDEESLRSVARSLPSESGGGRQPVDGPWSEDEANVLGRFFTGGRLVKMPSAARKRRLVLEKVALDFEPGRRYSEREVDVTIQLIHDDYAAIRRYLIDEGFMDRADGSYWRTGGRYAPPEPKDTGTEDVANRIDTGRPDVVLRPYTWGMIDELIDAANDERIPKYMGDEFAFPYTRKSAEEWLEIATGSSPPLQYAIYVDGAFAGGVGAFVFTRENAGVAEIGWWLNPRYWAGGITSAAVSAFIDEMFEHRGLERLWAPVMEPNVASARVAEKAGMTLEGVAPSHYVKQGVRMAALNFGITRSQWGDR